MIDLEKINLAIQVSQEEYARKYGIKKCRNLPGIFDAYNQVFEGVEKLSEQYLCENIKNIYTLNESIECMKNHIRLEAHEAKVQSLKAYMRINHEVN